MAAAFIVASVASPVGVSGAVLLLPPVLIGTGRPPAEVAPATLASTFLTSVGGVVAFVILSVGHSGPVVPDWGIGIALGVGGLLGGYTGARLQPHLPETVVRRLLGVLVPAVGIRYAWPAGQ